MALWGRPECLTDKKTLFTALEISVDSTLRMVVHTF